MLIINNEEYFDNRKEISNLLGGDMVKGIAVSKKYPIILLFANEDELYKDYFYFKTEVQYCLYTGIGKIGHQDSIENNMYDLNISVLGHKKDKKPLLVFRKVKNKYQFSGIYSLIETYQNVQVDESNDLRRVFMFNLKKINNSFQIEKL